MSLLDKIRGRVKKPLDTMSAQAKIAKFGLPRTIIDWMRLSIEYNLAIEHWSDEGTYMGYLVSCKKLQVERILKREWDIMKESCNAIRSAK